MELRKRLVVATVAVALAGTGAVLAQDPEKIEVQQEMMEAWQRARTPGPQHEMMRRMTGDFDLTVTMYMEPGADPEVSKATATRRMILGGRYLEETVEGTAMGEPFEGRGLTGYNNVTGKWWGTWVDNMSTGLMTSEGDWDEEKGTGTFWARASNPLTGETEKSRTVVRRLEGGDEVMETYMVTPHGEVKSMEILYQRRK